MEACATLLARLSRVEVLIVDDWAMAPLQDAERRDFWEICDERYQTRSTILTSQLPVARWHEQIGDATIADGILDRLVHNAHRIELRGESMRKARTQETGSQIGNLSPKQRWASPGVGQRKGLQAPSLPLHTPSLLATCLTIPITFRHNHLASVAALRSPDRNRRNADRLHPGTLIDFTGIRRGGVGRRTFRAE